MSDLVIRKCTVSEMETDAAFPYLLEEYAQELAIDGLPHPQAQIEMYKKLESIGSLQPIGAYYQDILIGFINVLMVMNPHYGVSIAVSESFFVAKEYRRTGAGLKLLHKAEDYSANLGSPGIFVSAPSDGVLSEVLPNAGYIEKSRAFFKRFYHA